MATIHPTAIVAPEAVLGAGVTIGPHAVVGPHVELGPGTDVGASCVIAGWTTIGRENRIFPGCVLGLEPQVVGFDAQQETYLRIGDRNVLREYVTAHRALKAYGSTTIGNDCYLMTYAHVAHDATVGSWVVLANSVSLAGHVEVADRVIISGLSGVHQFVKIGQLAMVGGCTKITKDLPPFMLADGNPARVRGLNSVGLRRNGFDAGQRRELKEAYRILYRSGLNVSQALDRIADNWPKASLPAELVEFVRASGRGILRSVRE